MSALVVDTSSWVSYFAGKQPAAAQYIDEALAESRLYLPPIVAAELVSGRLSRKQHAELESLLGDLPLCESELAHWLRVGQLCARLREKGLAVATPDAHVAQCALDLRAELLSEDGVFTLIARHAPLRLVQR